MVVRGNIPRNDTEMVDTGEWLACDECEAVIDSKRWPELIDRAVVGTMAMGPLQGLTEHNLRLRAKHVFSAVLGEAI